MIECGSFDLKSRGFARETAVAEHQLERLARIAKVKLRAELLWKSSRFKHGQDAHFIKEPAVVRQQRLADVEAREVLLLQHQHALAGAGEKSGRGAAAWPTADHQCIVALWHNSNRSTCAQWGKSALAEN